MFEDWARALSDVDLEGCDRVALRRLLGGSSRLRAALDRFDAAAAAALGEAAAVRSATRCTQREADRAVERGEFLAAAPAVGEALGDGTISGAHVDALSRAASRTSVDAVGASSLLEVAKAKPADAMRRQIDDFVRREADDADLQARAERQRARRRASMHAADMGVLPRRVGRRHIRSGPCGRRCRDGSTVAPRRRTRGCGRSSYTGATASRCHRRAAAPARWSRRRPGVSAASDGDRRSHRRHRFDSWRRPAPPQRGRTSWVWR